MCGKKALRAVAGASVAAMFVMSGFASAAPFLSTDLAVERVNGTASASAAVLVDEYAKTGLQGSPVQTLALPTGPAGSNLALTDSASATSNAQMTRSSDGSILVLSGYNTGTGTASVAGSDPNLINRTIGVVDSGGNVNTSRSFNNGPLNNFRSATSDDGTRFWVSTAGSATAPGVLLHNGTTGSPQTTSGILNGNTRNLGIFGGSLFASSSSSTPGVGISLVGSVGSLPTTLSSPTGPIATGGSAYGFYFFDLGATDYLGTGFDTLYVADDRSIASGGGLQKWTFDGTSWTLAYTMTTGLPSGASGGLRGLTAELVAGTPTLYVTNAGVTSGGTQGNSLFTVADAGATSPFTKLADSPTNTFFRGVAMAPVAVNSPEPASIGLLGIGTFVLSCRRRQRRHPRN